MYQLLLIIKRSELCLTTYLLRGIKLNITLYIQNNKIIIMLSNIYAYEKKKNY